MLEVTLGINSSLGFPAWQSKLEGHSGCLPGAGALALTLTSSLSLSLTERRVFVSVSDYDYDYDYDHVWPWRGRSIAGRLTRWRTECYSRGV